MSTDFPFEQQLMELHTKIHELKRFGTEKDFDLKNGIMRLEEVYKHSKKELYEKMSASQIMQIARHPKRPTTLDYISHVFTDFLELHGDRFYADDLAIVGGLAKLNGVPVTVIGHQRGVDTKDNIRRHFGSPHPEGFRKALRLMRQAAKFARPIITFIDTKGAYPGDSAEKRNQSEAIARNLYEMSYLGVPIICVIIGEGGSGGALALGVGDRVLMLQNAIYSVISPNGAASILWKDATKVNEAAEAMKITAKDLFRFGIIDEIIAEPEGGAHRNAIWQAQEVKTAIWKHLQTLQSKPCETLNQERYEKFRQIGCYLIQEE